MRSCTGVVVLPRGAEDIVAAAAVAESDDTANMNALTILHVLYADGIERIATDTPAEAARWAARIRCAPFFCPLCMDANTIFAQSRCRCHHRTRAHRPKHGVNLYTLHPG